MDTHAKIYVAGHRGLVGSALMRTLRSRGHENFLTRTHAELDLTDQAAVEAFFAAEKPDYVFLAAAKVGPRKRMDVGRLNAMGWKAKTGMREGLHVAYRDFWVMAGA